MARTILAPTLVQPAKDIYAFTTSSAERPQAPECIFMKALCKDPGHHVQFAIPSEPFTRDNPMDPFRLLIDAQLQEYVRALGQSSHGRQQRSKAEGDRQRRMMWRMKTKGLPITDFTKNDQAYTPELGHDAYI